MTDAELADAQDEALLDAVLGIASALAVMPLADQQRTIRAVMDVIGRERAKDRTPDD